MAVLEAARTLNGSLNKTLTEMLCSNDATNAALVHQWISYAESTLKPAVQSGDAGQLKTCLKVRFICAR
jgi:hypothetical protein